MVKKILSICSIEPTRLGSFEEHIIALTKKLNEREYKHVVAVVNEPIDIVFNELTKCGAEIKSFSESKSTLKNTITIIKLIKQVRPSLIHFHFFSPPYKPLNIYCFFNKIPLIYTEHFAPNKPGKQLLKNKFKRIYYVILSRLFNVGIYKIVCVSEFIKENHLKYYYMKSNKLIVIYNGLNLERFKFPNKLIKIKEDQAIITCVAGLTERKGVQYLIKAAPLIINEIPSVKFYIVGDGDYADTLKNMVIKMNLGNYFVFTGYRNDVEKILSESTVSVVPSVCYDALPFVAMESLALSVPVVASDIGGLGEIIEHGKTGYLVPTENIEKLSEKIVSLIQDPSKSHEYGCEGRCNIKNKFSIDRAIMEYIDLYEEIISSA